MPRPARLACCLTLLLTLGTAGAQTSAAGLAAGTTVTVQRGDTAYSLARRAGISVDRLLALNGLSSAQLRVGQVLRVGELRVHVVQPGETVYALARRYGVSVDALLYENTLPLGATLRPGQTLRLPGSALTASAAPPPAARPAVPPAPPLPPATAAPAPLPAQATFSGVLGSPFLPAAPPQEQPTLLPPRPLPSALPTLPTGAAGVAPAPAPAPLPTDWRSAALALLGTPYLYGGMGRSGTDCSGLVLQVFTPLGIVLPRVSADQARAGQPVNAGEWQGGDLVFFDTEGQGRVSHVGIYLGDDTFISANSFQGQVSLDHLTSDRYWSARYLGARRVLTASLALRP